MLPHCFNQRKREVSVAQQECPSYYWIRAAEEMERGDRSDGPAAAAVYYELAYRYGLLATRMSAGPPKLSLIQGGRSQSLPLQIVEPMEGFGG